MRPTRADAVVVAEDLKEDFFKRHRKDRKRAEEAWAGLVARRSNLEADTTYGEPVSRRQWPRRFRGLPNLWLIPELPHRFRALYTVVRHPERGVLLRVEWIGDHAEYDALFRYRRR